MSSLIPNAEQQFFDLSGNPLAGGSVYFYSPGTMTPVNTWQDQALTILNTNPVVLDASGKAIIWGPDATSYRQIVQDSLGNTIWDQTAATTLGAVLTTAGDIVIGGSAGAQTRLPIGADGQVLEVVSGAPAWTNLAAPPVTTLGDIYVGGTGGAPSRLPVGATGQVVTVVGGVPAWANNPAGFANPMTAQYDLIIGGTGGAPQRLGIGANGQILGVSSATVGWIDNSSPALPVNAQTGTAYTLALTDAPAANGYQGIVTMDNASANTVTVPPNSSVPLPVGAQIPVIQLGAGQTAVAAGAGVTVYTPSTLPAMAQYGKRVLTQVAANTWVVG